jgi:hypothetical protein
MNEAGDVGANEEAPNMIHAHQPMGANNSSDSERLSKENNEIVPSSSQMSNSSSDPLRGDIDDSAHRQLSGDFHFQIKMYWEEGFCWQDEWRERKWCWQCEVCMRCGHRVMFMNAQRRCRLKESLFQLC